MSKLKLFNSGYVCAPYLHNRDSLELKESWTSSKNIEKLFKVNVIKVNIINQKSKMKIKQGKKSTKSGYKKAIITLKKGQSIDLTTGI